MNRIDTIVFDLGGVLIDWNPEYVYKTIFDKEEDMRWFLENITTGHWNEEQDAGRSLAEGTELLVKQHPTHEQNIRAFYDRWEEMLGGAIQGTVDIFQHLKNNTNYRLYALTNWSAETFPIALKRYPFLHWFQGIVVSGDENTRKPYLPIYQTSSAGLTSTRKPLFIQTTTSGTSTPPKSLALTPSTSSRRNNSDQHSSTSV